MTENDTNPEQSAKLALEEYMYLDPSINLGQVDGGLLRNWHERCNSAHLTPEQRLLAGWIDVELAIHLNLVGITEDEREEAVSLLADAIQSFSNVASYPNVQHYPLLQAQAHIAQGGASVLRIILQGGEVDEAFQDYARLQGLAAEEVLAQLANTRSAPATMMADSLTLLMVLCGANYGGLPLPCSPRNLNPGIDGYYRWNIILLQGRRLIPLRVGESGPSELVTIPQELFKQSGLPSRSGYGTLEALIKQQRIINNTSLVEVMGRQVIERIPVGVTPELISKLQGHTKRVAQSIMDSVHRQVEALTAIDFDPEHPPTPSDRREWYRSLHPQRSAYLASVALFDEAIGQHEAALALETISPGEMRELAWMYIEGGTARAASPYPSMWEITNEYDRAEAIFAQALIVLENERDSSIYYETWLGAASVPLYRAVARREEAIGEQLSEYVEALIVVAEQGVHHYTNLANKKSQEAVDLDQFLQLLTVILLTATESGGSYIPLIAVPRQRGKGGWDIHIWPETAEGFVPVRSGRLRITNTENKLTLSEGIITFTPSAIGQKPRDKRTATLQAIVDNYRGRRNDTSTKRINTARKSLSMVVNSVDA